MFLRLGIFSVCILAAVHVAAQRDSTVLQSVTVYGMADQKYLAGSQFFSLDSTLHRQQDSRHLGELLQYEFPVYFRNYGNGMLSGISLRGTAPQHVAVRWNGININSFSLGQADFSILPGVAFADVKVHAGAGSARFGSGAFGGSILLQSDSKGPLVAVSQEVGSYGRYFTSLKGSFTLGKLSSTTSLYRVQADNDFLIKAIDQRQPHAAYWQQGIVQSFQYTLSPSKTVSLQYWYNDSWKEIQPPIGNANSNDEQADQNHRLAISYEQSGRRGQLKTTAGMVQDKIIYNQSPSTILRYIANANYAYTFEHDWNVWASAEWNHIIGKIDEYGPDEPVEDRVDVAAGVQKVFGPASLSLNLRQPFVTGIQAPLLPYVGADVR